MWVVWKSLRGQAFVSEIAFPNGMFPQLSFGDVVFLQNRGHNGSRFNKVPRCGNYGFAKNAPAGFPPGIFLFVLPSYGAGTLCPV
ncbi:hypothetical protein [uncultured Neglectibacter sp.]|uniref:hypothetical protein n=1 Tax=uncultured Neglectibacter sp. TaxID=1924108 RepID=UPI0034DF73DE